jgi:nitrate/TMAO reductase-like tetraheme cytochrome c subunit
MNNTPSPERSPRFGVFRNWTSLTGVTIILGSLFAFFLLFLLDTFAHFSNPYVGVLTYLVTPVFLAIGTAFVIAGVLWQRRKQKKSGAVTPTFSIDLSRRRDRKLLGLFLGGAAVFLFVTALLSYHSYHYTESVQFCGQACHTVMKPELVTYQHGSHARVACAECHIGSGATWYVRSKLSGSYQLYAVAFNKYPRPVPTPIKNLRPAQETCEQCHWPKKFVGNLDRTYNYFLGDETNTPWSVRLTMKVGGGDPTHGPGIHWHMNVGNKVEYIAAKREKDGSWTDDETRQRIPYVRFIDSQGAITEYRERLFTNSISGFQLRTVDCMDCHNRPAHKYQTPNDAVNLAISLGKLDRAMPWIKTNSVYALTLKYTNETQALQTIATKLNERYPGDPRTRQAIDTVQQIYRDNFFPEMNANWAAYPDNIGHMEWSGCFRCHDGEHRTADGKRTIKANDCNACHTILAQGSGEDMNKLTPNGQKFKHPGDDVSGKCNDCHTGSNL